MEHRLISELNHEIAKMKTLAQSIGPSTQDNQKLRDKLVSTRQRCWDLCKHVRDNVLPRVERQTLHGTISNGRGKSSYAERTASLLMLVETLKLLYAELDKLHGLVVTFPPQNSKLNSEGMEELTPIDTFICLTSTGCIITPDIALASMEEIRRNNRQMEANRILRDKKEVLHTIDHLEYHLDLAKKDFESKNDNKCFIQRPGSSSALSRTMSAQGPRRASMNPVRRTSLPVCCLLYCACRKTYL